MIYKEGHSPKVSLSFTVYVFTLCVVAWLAYVYRYTRRVWMGRGFNVGCQLKLRPFCQLSVKFSAICQLSVIWMLIGNY